MHAMILILLQMIITCGCSDDIKNGLELSKTRGAVHISLLFFLIKNLSTTDCELIFFLQIS